MNKTLKKILCLLITCVLMTINVGIETKAAGGLSISATATQDSSGGTFTVTVKTASNYFVSGIKISVSGGTVVSGLGKTSLDRGETTSAKIKLTGDTCVVSVSGDGANYDTETEGTASASVTVKKKVSTSSNNSNNNNSNTTTNTKSKDNTLSALTVSEGTLSPGFNASTTEYNVAVSGTTEKITIGAKTNHVKASLTGTGEKTLVPGHNWFTIVCTAENGSKKEYKVDVYVDETPLVFTTYNNQKLGVVRNQTNIGIPTSFEPTTLLLEGTEVKAYHSNQMNVSLVYLVNELGEKNFYIYEEGHGITSIFRPVSILGRNVIVYDLPKEEQTRDNMVYSEVTIDGTTLYGWTYENPDFANYIHISVMNEFGEKVVYQYEKTENSLQLYKEYVELDKVEDVDQAPIEKTWFPNEYYMYAIVGLGALSLILLIAMIYFIASRKARHEGRKKKAIKRQEKQRAKEERQREKEARELEKYRQILEEEREKERQIEEKRMAKQKAKEEKKLAKQKKREE